MGEITMRQFTGYLFSGPRVKVGGQPRTVNFGKFRTNGRIGLVSTYENGHPQNPGSLALFEPDANGLYRLSSVATNGGPGPAEVFDFNRDSRLDVCVASFGNGPVSTHLGDGDGTFQQAMATPAAGAVASSEVAGDLDRNGMTDLVAWKYVLVGRGDGSFTTAQILQLGNYNEGGVALGDLDGDAVPDLVAVGGSFAGSYANSQYSVYRGAGDGTFRLASTLPMSGYPTAAALADLSGDGKLDLIVKLLYDPQRGIFDPQLVVLQGIGDGTFGPEQPVTEPQSSNYSPVRTADLDGDGRIDIIDASSFEVSVLSNAGGGLFSPAAVYGVGAIPVDVRIGDLDDDGVPDVVTANTSSNDLSILYGRGGGILDDYRALTAGQKPTAIAAADMNGDGFGDLVVINGLPTPQASILLGRGNGSFLAPVSYALGGSNAGTVVRVADVNHDGRLDVVTVVDSTVVVLLGRGDGTVASPGTYGVGDGPNDLVIADLDGDGVPDLAVANSGSNDISLLYGIGDGRFTTEQRITTGSVGRLAIADLDGDGSADIAVTRPDLSGVGTYFGHGSRLFSTGAVLPVASDPNSFIVALIGPPGWVSLADLNHDGKIDIVTSDLKSGYVSVLLGIGAGAFSPAQLFNDPVFFEGVSEALTLADVNQDGNLDVVLGTGDSEVNVLVGNGDGTFVQPQVFDAGPCDGRIATGDFDNDGLIDLVVADECSSTQNVDVLIHR